MTTPPPTPGQKRETEDDCQRKLTALRARLHEEAQAVHTPEDWNRCLRLTIFNSGGYQVWSGGAQTRLCPEG